MPTNLERACLGDLEVGDAAVVESVRCERATAVRLMEMGLCRGTRVEVRRRAPLGDPIELFVSGYSLSIRKAEALGVRVTEVERRAPARGAAQDEREAHGPSVARARNGSAAPSESDATPSLARVAR